MRKKVVINGDYAGYKLKMGRYYGAKLFKAKGWIDLNRNTVAKVDFLPILTKEDGADISDKTDDKYTLVTKSRYHFDDTLFSNRLLPRVTTNFEMERKQSIFKRKQKLFRVKISFKNGKSAEIDLVQKQANALFCFIGVIN